jgi:hypothetical protein
MKIRLPLLLCLFLSFAGCGEVIDNAVREDKVNTEQYFYTTTGLKRPAIPETQGEYDPKETVQYSKAVKKSD